MMKKNPKKAVLLTLASVMTLSLTAREGGSSSGIIMAVQAESEEAEGKEAESGSEDMTIKFCWWGGDSRHEATEKVVDVFTAKYPNTKAECEYGARTGWRGKQFLVTQGGNATDVMQINWDWITFYSGNGVNFANLEDYGNVLDLTQFPQGNLDQCKADSKLMAMPMALTGRPFCWNKTTFGEIGCEISTDEVSLLEAGTRFETYSEDHYPLVTVEHDRAIPLVCYLESAYDEPWIENGEPQCMAEEIQAGMDFMTRLEEAYAILIVTILQGDMADPLDKNAKVIDGKYMGVSEWDSAASKVQKVITESITRPGRELIIGDFLKLDDYDSDSTKISTVLAVSANSAHLKKAAMLINCLSNGDKAIEIRDIECGTPYFVEGVKTLEEKGIGDKLVMEANTKVLAHSKFPLDPMFEHGDPKASPDGVHYKVSGKLSVDDTTSAQTTKDLMKGIGDRYNF